MFRTLGETISVKSRSWIGPAAPRRTVLGIDIILLLSVFTLLVFGLLMVYSASWDDSIQVYGNPTTIFFRQLLFALSGLLVIGWMTMMDYHHWQKLALPAIAATLVLLAIVLAIGEVRNNAVRTLVGGSIQPSELAKLVAVIYLSAWMYSKREQLSSISFGLAPLAAILGIIGGLIFLQPDLSAVITIFFLRRRRVEENHSSGDCSWSYWLPGGPVHANRPRTPGLLPGWLAGSHRGLVPHPAFPGGLRERRMVWGRDWQIQHQDDRFAFPIHRQYFCSGWRRDRRVWFDRPGGALRAAALARPDNRD
jgi:hypothetical protein